LIREILLDKTWNEIVGKIIYFIVSSSLIIHVILLLIFLFESCLDREMEIVVKCLPLVIEHIESSL